MKTPSAKESAIYGITSELQEFIDLIGMGFHPDTDFSDYIDKINDKPSFSKSQAARLNARLHECFELAEKYNIDVYEIALNLMQAEFDKATH